MGKTTKYIASPGLAQKLLQAIDMHEPNLFRDFLTVGTQRDVQPEPTVSPTHTPK